MEFLKNSSVKFLLSTYEEEYLKKKPDILLKRSQQNYLKNFLEKYFWKFIGKAMGGIPRKVY